MIICKVRGRKMLWAVSRCSSTTLIQINWGWEPYGYAENRIIGFFSENRLHWQFEVWL